MKSKPEQSFRCLTLYKQDIITLANMFHYYFQRVEIFIDDIPILYPSQLDACTPDYKAKLLVLRGYHLEWTGEGEQRHTQFRLVEVRATKQWVTLVGWKANEKHLPEAAVELKNFFVNRQNDTQNGLLILVFWGTYMGWGMGLFNEINHNLSWWLIPFTSLALVLFGFFALFLLVVILRYFQLDTYVFLLPGAVQTERTYGTREVNGTLLVGIVQFFVLIVFTTIAIDLLKHAHIFP